jgi:hypothetical protein
MSVAARARRSRRGTRQYLRFVLGLAFLASAFGVAPGSHPLTVHQPSPPAVSALSSSAGSSAVADPAVAAVAELPATDTVAVAPAEPAAAVVTIPRPRTTAKAGRVPMADAPRAPPA